MAALDFGVYKVGADRRVFLLKPGGGFRAAVQLDPLDHLCYTAVVYEAAELIEKARIPSDQRIACSYRLQLTPEGSFFQADSGWKDFHEHVHVTSLSHYRENPLNSAVWNY